MAATTTNNDGDFRFPALQPVVYDLAVEVKGFRKEIVRNIKIDAGLERALPPFALEVSSQAEVIEVAAEAVGVQTSNAEIAATVTNDQIRRLPTLNRSPLALITTQAGVGGNGRTNTTINGMRPSFTNVTIDGINIQDNFIRTNALDFLPNLLLMDQVEEMTIATTNTNASDGSGASQIKFVTPSGTNRYKGSLYWLNRNNIASANTWFNNRNRITRPFLNQNQAGGSLGGPIVKDKLFFYGNYELFRLRQQSSATRTILRQDARNGIFTYRTTGGTMQKINLFSALGVRPDPITQQILSQIPGPEFINRNDVGDNMNTGGYSFNIRNNRTRDNATAKIDYVASTKHVFTGTYLWNRDIVDRPDLANDYSTVPKVQNDGAVNLLSGTWRWSPVSNFTNELRGGFNLTPAVFATSESFGNAIFALPLVGNPLNTFRAQGRFTDTYNLQNNSNYFLGKHSLSFGFQWMKIITDPYNDAGNIATYTLGISAANPNGITGTVAPGIISGDVGTGNGLVALHAGFLTQMSQTFNATAIGSGFIPGATSARALRMDNVAGFISDNWKITRKLTLTLGTRWEFYTPVTEKNGLALMPVLQNGNVVQTMLNPVGTLDYAGNVVGRPFYKKDWNNFSPNVGFSWAPFGDGKTVIRGGYSINFPNDDFIRSIDNNVISTNSGLSAPSTVTNLTQTASTRPAVPVPAFKVPRTYADNNAIDSQSAIGMPDPNLATPYVQQWSFGVQREMGGGILEVRYVGNRATKQFRAFDYNQVLVRPDELPGYFQDFQRALNNGNLARNATGTFNPAYNPSIVGSQQLPFFAQLSSGGLLTNATIRGLIERGEVGELANTYQINRLNGPFSFYRNRNMLGTNMMSNYSIGTYHGGQVDYRRRFAKGFQLQANYVYAKVMSDSAGDAQTRFEPFLDNQNPQIEKARTPFDLTHSFKLNGLWELPIGKGRLVNIQNSFLDQIIGGWEFSGIMTWNSGAPVSILSGRGTLNRGARSGQSGATVLTDKSGLQDVIGFRQTPDGPYFIAASAIGADGRGVGPDGRAPFSGQMFYNPNPGELGGLQRRYFDGPSFWGTDIAILKKFTITERQRLEFRAEMFNFSNTPMFFIGDQNINSTTFGRITTTASGRRVVQFGLNYRF